MGSSVIAEVVELRPPADKPVDGELVDALVSFLARIRAGEITSVTVVAVTDKHEISTFISHEGQLVELIAGLAAAQRRALDMLS